jgi:hypothetical protein
MTVCANESELGAAFDAFMRDEVEETVSEATKAYARAVYHYATTLKTTWSAMQPGDIWTGQFRYSVNVSVGNADASALPYMMPMQPWPIADKQYDMSDVISGIEAVSSVPLYGSLVISNNAPHAANVELHTGIFRTAAELAARDMAGTNWSNVSAGNSIPF